MNKTYLMNIILGTVIGIILAFGTVFAVPDVYQNIRSWAEKELQIAQNQVQAKAGTLSEEEQLLLTSNVDQILSDLNAELNQIGSTQITESKLHINEMLDEYNAEMKDSSQKTSEGSSSLFTAIINKANTLVNELLELGNPEGEQVIGGIELVNYDQNNLLKERQFSNQSLEKEIHLTTNTINQLKKIQAAEDNEAIKDFIQRKIDLLNEIMIVLQTEH